MFLSALPRERGSDVTPSISSASSVVSIRAPPRTRERPEAARWFAGRGRFYPRSPANEGATPEGAWTIDITSFYPRSPANEGATAEISAMHAMQMFLSALPRERGSDSTWCRQDQDPVVSIRAPPRTRERLGAFRVPHCQGVSIRAPPRTRERLDADPLSDEHITVSIRAPPRTRERPPVVWLSDTASAFLSALPRERGSDSKWVRGAVGSMFLSALPRERGSDVPRPVDARRCAVSIRAPPRTRERRRTIGSTAPPMVSIRAPPRTRERQLRTCHQPSIQGFYPRSPANEGATAQSHARRLASQVSIRAPPRTRERPRHR